MKKFFINIITFMLLITTTFSLVGCGALGNFSERNNYNSDVKEVLPEDITNEHFIPEENKTYYTSDKFQIVISVKGNFMVMDYFTIDGEKRIYDNLFFYEEDYLFVITTDYKDIYASLSDRTDTQYAEEEKEQGEDVQLNFIKSGVYKVIFDVKTCQIDLEYKSEIEVPKYYTIKNCSIFSSATEWVEMMVNPNNQDEFYISDFQIDTGKTISFFNNLHVSNYYVTLDLNSQKYASCEKTAVKIFIGGKYNVYINAKNYEVRLELLNPDTADYTCCYYENDLVSLQAPNKATPYIFTYKIEVENRYGVKIPNFYNTHYQKYNLTVLESPNVTSSEKYYYFFGAGSYKLTINLKTFELTVKLLPQ